MIDPVVVNDRHVDDRYTGVRIFGVGVADQNAPQDTLLCPLGVTVRRRGVVDAEELAVEVGPVADVGERDGELIGGTSVAVGSSSAQVGR